MKVRCGNDSGRFFTAYRISSSVAAANAYLAFACGLADLTRAGANFRADCESNVGG